jgi:hypothetical protein
MMHLAPHIAKLLEKHDCVIIPSFGGIISNYKGATIHPTRHLFSPPSRQLLFNKNLVSNDGLLANKLSEDLGLSYAQAVHLISDEVNALVSMLNNGQRIYWPGVGGFFLDVEKNIQFTQDSLQNYLSDSFGMPELEVKELQRSKCDLPFIRMTHLKEQPANVFCLLFWLCR